MFKDKELLKDFRFQDTFKFYWNALYSLIVTCQVTIIYRRFTGHDFPIHDSWVRMFGYP